LNSLKRLVILPLEALKLQLSQSGAPGGPALGASRLCMNGFFFFML